MRLEQTLVLLSILLTFVDCRSINLSSYARTIPVELQEELSHLIYPGTKWCGPGNISRDHDDLGEKRETDACCREHDNCPDQIDPHASKHGLTNNALYSRLSCDCDETFYDCLQRVDAESNDRTLIGFIYFDLIYTQCYREDYPIVGCVTEVAGRCLEYDFDETKPKTWQWFDEPFYY